jgi:hypothetical protein
VCGGRERSRRSRDEKHTRTGTSEEEEEEEAKKRGQNLSKTWENLQQKSMPLTVR